jgi:hypothetical protein
MGERHAAVRADGSGTELRVENRWAAVRREQPAPGGPGVDQTGDRAGRRPTGGYWSERADQPWADQPWAGQQEVAPGSGDREWGTGSRSESAWSGPALPAGRAGGTWSDEGGRHSGDPGESAHEVRIGSARESAGAGWQRSGWEPVHDERRDAVPDLEPARGRRHRDEPRYGYPPADDVPRAGGTRWSDDDRWR